MRIKVSKSQWVEMGQKTGWFKKAQIIPDDGFADGGTPYTDEELDIMNKQENKPKFDKFYDMEKGDRGKVPKIDAYYLIKFYQMWGWCPTYRKIDGSKDDILFYDQQTNQLLNWPEMKALLKETWRPAGREEQDWFVANLGD
jgi:hypothetical protein